MLDIRELRIGNWINDSHCVVGIYLDMIETTEDAEMLLECIEPVPLTEEWLLTFGFVENNGFFSSNLSTDYYVDYCIKSNTWELYLAEYTGIFMLDITYVHQLQNLYFALTGEELEIKE